MSYRQAEGWACTCLQPFAPAPKPDHISEGCVNCPLRLQVQRKLTVVDDLPHAGDPQQRRRLTELLVQLARTSRFPTAVIVTGSHAQSGGSFGGAGKPGSFQGWHRVRRSSAPACQTSAVSPQCDITNCFPCDACWKKIRLMPADAVYQCAQSGTTNHEHMLSLPYHRSQRSPV